MEKFNSGKVPKYFSRADVQGNTALTCDLVAWSCQVRIHTFPLYCFPCAISCVCWLRRAHTSIVACSSSHRRAVLPAIDSLQESRNDSRRREDIYTDNVTSWRNNPHRKIKFAGIAGFLIARERRTRIRYRGERNSFDVYRTTRIWRWQFWNLHNKRKIIETNHMARHGYN